MTPKYIVAVSDCLITHETIDDAVKHGEGCDSVRPLVVYEIRAVSVVHPVKGLTSDDFTPPPGGTPMLMRMAA